MPQLVRVVERYGMDMSRRFIMVDLASQTMIVWDPGQPTRIMPVSTGDESRGYRTLAWYGLVGDYWGTFHSSGVYADEGWYLFEDVGHILIHGTPYRIVGGQKVYEQVDALAPIRRLRVVSGWLLRMQRGLPIGIHEAYLL
jgi:hypothetical protein